MYTINEVAKEFKVSHWTVSKWIDNKLKLFKQA